MKIELTLPMKKEIYYCYSSHFVANEMPRRKKKKKKVIHGKKKNKKGMW